MGRSAVNRLKDGIKSASPSKETMKAGAFFSQGFALGIEEEESLAVDAATSLANATLTALNGTTGAYSLDTNGREIVGVYITGNQFTVRDDYDIERIGYELNRQINRQTAGAL